MGLAAVLASQTAPSGLCVSELCSPKTRARKPPYGYVVPTVFEAGVKRPGIRTPGRPSRSASADTEP